MTETLGIVTTCRGYGQYLREWAQSIIGLTRKPDRVVVLTHGDRVDDCVSARDAVALLQAAGLDAVHWFEGGTLDFGAARNRAVEQCPTDWVMHLDADDTLMPHALDDWAALKDQADVVCFGYARSGDLLAGPKNRTKIYEPSAGPTTLANPTPCSGVSPFRRAFWVQAPYCTDLAGGGWDTALWLGFAHLGARFVPTNRPCFHYRQHADSLFNVRRKAGWPAALVGHQLQAKRRGDTGVSVVIPRSRVDSPARQRAADYVRRWYAAHFPAWQVVEGWHERGPWVKGAAVWDALRHATGKTLVLADADCLVGVADLQGAVDAVMGGAPWAIPHLMVRRLAQDVTEHVLRSDPAEWSVDAVTSYGGGDIYERQPGVPASPYKGFAGGGLLVVNRAAYCATGGFPTTFHGWGAEDEALALILDTLVGKHVRGTGDLIHLWHETNPGRDKLLARHNRKRWMEFRNVAGNMDRMWRLLHPGRDYGQHAVEWLHATHAERQAAVRASVVGGPR